MNFHLVELVFHVFNDGVLLDDESIFAACFLGDLLEFLLQTFELCIFDEGELDLFEQCLEGNIGLIRYSIFP